MKKQTQTSNGCAGVTEAFRLGFQRARNMFLCAVLVSLGCGITAYADRVGHDVAAAFVKVDQIPDFATTNSDDNLNWTVSLPVTVNGFQSAYPLGNRADYRFKIGEDASDDVATGVMIGAAAQNLRNSWGGSNLTHTVSVSLVAGNTQYEIASQSVPLNAAASIEDNVNLGVAWFPYATWIGGVARNSTNLNGGLLETLTGSPGLVLGTHFIDAKTTNNTVNGRAYLDLRSFGIDSRRDGVLLVNHAKNEANYALSQINEEDGTWTIFCHDNRANGQSYEQDPLAFVFVPKSNTNIVSGMFSGDGEILIHSGNTPAFTVTERLDLGNGQFELKVPGRSPNDGVLVISAAGGNSNNGDNIVTYEANAAGDGWIIQTRDLPNAGLQNLPGNEPVCSFVFIPAERPGISVTPNKNLQTSESGAAVLFDVTLTGYPKPTANVTVNLSSSDTTEGTVSTPTLTFTPDDWGVPQAVVLMGVDDLVADGTVPYTVNLSATVSTDPNYNGLVPANVGAINIDNEPGVSVDAASIVTTEAGGTATFNVWLNTMPTANVTLAINSSDTTEATVSPASLTFTPADYSTPQLVTVTGVDDFVQDGTTAYYVVTVAATSTDPAYNNFNALDVAGQNLDNDLAKVIIPADAVTISEPTTTANIAVKLGSEPTANVTVSFTSGDTSEGTVTPSLTFTPANWSTPQNAIVTAVDDLVNDGPVEFNLTATVTSADPIYAATLPTTVSVTTIDNEAALTLPSGDFVYGIGDIAKGLDGYATIIDSDTADYNSGSVTVTLAGATSSDRFAVRNDGTTAGLIGVAGSTVSYGGVNIGTISGGTGASPLSITLNSSANAVSTEALIRAITYQNIDANAASQTRVVSVALADGDGGVSTVTKSLVVRQMRVYTFQQDGDGGFGRYTGAADGQIHNGSPTTSFPAGYNASGLWLDYDPATLDMNSQPQAFVRFTNIFGTGPGQIPTGARIVAAEVIMNVTDSGHGARFNRMLIDWDADSVTYDGLVSGVQLDDVEAVSGTNAFLSDQAHNTTVGGGRWAIGVTTDVQAWANGTNNYGWVLSVWEGGDNGTAFSPCEATNITLRPQLRVSWLPPETPSVTFRQDVNGYVGTKDTYVRLANPDTTYETVTVLAPDYLVNATPIPNPQQVLIKFDDIVGSGANQIPPGAVIHAAVLEVTSINADAQGNGGLFHAMLTPWDETNTWNSFTDGVSADNVEAVTTPTVTLPATGLGTVQATRHNIELTADVQAWANQTRANNGWVILPWVDGNNGWGFNSANANPIETRPELRVYYTPGSLAVDIKLDKPVYNGTQVQLTFTGAPNTTYTVQRIGALGGTWQDLTTVTTSGTGAGSYTDNSPLPNGAFYRIKK